MGVGRFSLVFVFIFVLSLLFSGVTTWAHVITTDKGNPIQHEHHITKDGTDTIESWNGKNTKNFTNPDPDPEVFNGDDFNQPAKRSEDFTDKEKKELRDQKMRWEELGFVTFVNNATKKFNCHGQSFKNREVQVFGDFVGTILKDQGWKKVDENNTKVGDIIIYRDSRGNVLHSGIVTKVEFLDTRIGIVTEVQSKWGESIEYRHHPKFAPDSYQPPGGSIEFWTGGKPLKGGEPFDPATILGIGGVNVGGNVQLSAAVSCGGVGDYDSDGVLDSTDNCPTLPNRHQDDSDGDGIGDLCDDQIAVIIDIQPGDFPNFINKTSNGTVPVAILSSFFFTDFNSPNQVDINSLTFGRTGNELSLSSCSNPQDVDEDGLLDLVCHFEIQKTSFKKQDDIGLLVGKTLNGEPFLGFDFVVLDVGAKDKEPPGKEKVKEPKVKGPKGPQQQGIITPSGNFLPPVKQMKMGLTVAEVLCNEGKELIFKSTDGSPKCVSMVTAEKLVERGWATK